MVEGETARRGGEDVAVGTCSHLGGSEAENKLEARPGYKPQGFPHGDPLP